MLASYPTILQFAITNQNLQFPSHRPSHVNNLKLPNLSSNPYTHKNFSFPLSIPLSLPHRIYKFLYTHQLLLRRRRRRRIRVTLRALARGKAYNGQCPVPVARSICMCVSGPCAIRPAVSARSPMMMRKRPITTTAALFGSVQARISYTPLVRG